MKRIWILVHTHRGFIESPEIFFSKQDAEKRRVSIMKEIFNEDYDEIGIFEKNI